MSQQASNTNQASLYTVLTFMYKYKVKLISTVVAVVLTSLVSLSFGQAINIIVTRAVNAGGATHDELNFIIVLAMVLLAVYSTGLFIRQYSAIWLGERVGQELQKAVFNNIIQVAPNYFESNPAGQVQTRITADTEVVQNMISTSFPNLINALFLIVGSTIFAFYLNTTLTLMVIVCVPVIFLPLILAGKKLRLASAEVQQKTAQVGDYVGETLRNIKVVQANNHQKRDRETFAEQVNNLFVATVKILRIQAWMNTSIHFLAVGALGLLIYKGGNDIIEGTMTIGELLAYLFYANVLTNAAATFSSVLASFHNARGASDNLIELMNVRSTIVEASAKDLKPLSLKPKGDIRVENVEFCYPTRPDIKALAGLSFNVPAGAHVALVGPSGAGKSTVFDLLLRFYNLGAGGIYIDDVNIENIKLRQLRDVIAIVPQEPVLFSGTIIENIRYGNIQATDEEVMRAAEQAYAHQFISELPNGYETNIGSAGVRLSGGQKQRIVIARAILKKPCVLLLDEATSALDTESEELVQKALEHVMQDCTTLVIAHRMATITNVDQILVFDCGRVVETGDHKHLSQHSAFYRNCVKAQLNLDSDETGKAEQNNEVQSES